MVGSLESGVLDLHDKGRDLNRIVRHSDPHQTLDLLSKEPTGKNDSWIKYILF